MAIRLVRDPRSRDRARVGLAFAAALIGASLAGCGNNRIVQDNDRGADARLRHPIALVEQPYSTDLFPTGGATLDDRTITQIASFAQRYKQLGHGPIAMIVPQSGHRQLVDTRALDQIRRELGRSGANTPVAVSHYPIENPALASPVRLSFDGIKATVTHRCGDWPRTSPPARRRPDGRTRATGTSAAPARPCSRLRSPIRAI